MTVPVTDLATRSIQIIRDGQTESGAYLASPTFATYRYSWFRDGAFIAEAMDDRGQHDSSTAFHDWAVRTLLTQPHRADLTPGMPPPAGAVLHTRYAADGTPGGEEWPNFQLDGFGTWLWAFDRHVRRTGRSLDGDAHAAVRLVADYLLALWPQPNFDCWEEHADRVHPSTLGAIVAGLRAAAQLLQETGLAGAGEAIRTYLLLRGVDGGHFVKHLGAADTVDANLLWLGVPYGILPSDHPVMTETAAAIRRDLLDRDGGVHRYLLDTYYGGGAWPLLTAALAQHHAANGERDEALRLLRWIEAQVQPEGHLPEQIAEHAFRPDRISEWNERWGSSACPLLWSHAAYLSLLTTLEASDALHPA
jgi:GH15 family glucan-1,4-alpha-glucosidase